MIYLKPVKIIVVGDSGSIHSARFICLLQELRYRIKVFQSEFCYVQDEHLKKANINVVFPYNESVNGNVLEGFPPFFGRLAAVLQSHPLIYKKFFKFINKYGKANRRRRVKNLVKLITSYKPNIIISLKMQNNGYIVSEAKKILGEAFTAKWVHFSWGSDIELFGKDPRYKKEHLPKIFETLQGCDYFLTDSYRDVEQAARFGFSGKKLSAVLAMGGFDLNQMTKIRSKNYPRNLILIKGRQDKMG